MSYPVAEAGVPLTTQSSLEYHYAGDQLVAITDFGEPFLRFTYDVLGPAAVTYNASTYYYLRNAQGDIVGLTDSDGRGYCLSGGGVEACGSLWTKCGITPHFSFVGLCAGFVPSAFHAVLFQLVVQGLPIDAQ